MSDQEEQDQRQHIRRTINREFESIDEFVAEYVTNISRSGVFIRSKSPLPVGTQVNLKFSIILDDFETIEGEGQVVRVVDDGAERGMGVQFTDLTERSREVLDRLLAEYEARGGSTAGIDTADIGGGKNDTDDESSEG